MGDDASGDVALARTMQSDAAGLASGDVPSIISERYRIGKPLGRGGFGAVYEAVDQRLDKKVAVKILDEERARTDAGVRQFRAEALAASRLRHPGIIAVTDYEVLPDGRPFLVMEFATGETLETLLAHQGALPPAEAARIAREIAVAVAIAHAADIVHRDLKPANVMYEPGGPATVKILDFGVAKIADAGKSATGEGTLVGTPHYMAPEQIREHVGPLGPRTDVYAIGIILYELLTAKPPFAHVKNVAELLLAQLSDRPPSLPTTVPAWLDKIVMRALEKEPAKRFESAQALADALSRGSAQATTLTSGEQLPSRGGPARRSAARIAAAVAIAATVAAVIIVSSAPTDRASASRPTVPAVTPEDARHESERAADGSEIRVPAEVAPADAQVVDAAAAPPIPITPAQTKQPKPDATRIRRNRLPDAPRETFEVPAP